MRMMGLHRLRYGNSLLRHGLLRPQLHLWQCCSRRHRRHRRLLLRNLACSWFLCLQTHRSFNFFQTHHLLGWLCPRTGLLRGTMASLLAIRSIKATGGPRSRCSPQTRVDLQIWNVTWLFVFFISCSCRLWCWFGNASSFCGNRFCWRLLAAES